MRDLLTFAECSPRELWREAGAVARSNSGVLFDSCCILNARCGGCSEDCRWCAQSHLSTARYTPHGLVGLSEALAVAADRSRRGIRRFSLVTSGRALSDADVDRLCLIYERLRAEVPIHLCLSAGLLGAGQLRRLRAAGCERYHCNVETAPSLFGRLCGTHTQADKLRTIEAARSAGMSVCSGLIVGMGETLAQRVELCEYLRDVVRPDSIPVNALVPIAGTGLAGRPSPALEEVRTMVALLRLTNPTAQIRLAGGRSQYPPEALLRCVESGADGAIVGDLLTTAGPRSFEEDREELRRAGYTL